MFSAKQIVSMVLIPKLEIRFCLDDIKADFRLTEITRLANESYCY
jgi:hypothetical protein